MKNPVAVTVWMQSICTFTTIKQYAGGKLRTHWHAMRGSAAAAAAAAAAADAAVRGAGRLAAGPDTWRPAKRHRQTPHCITSHIFVPSYLTLHPPWPAHVCCTSAPSHCGPATAQQCCQRCTPCCPMLGTAYRTTAGVFQWPYQTAGKKDREDHAVTLVGWGLQADINGTLIPYWLVRILVVLLTHEPTLLQVHSQLAVAQPTHCQCSACGVAGMAVHVQHRTVKRDFCAVQIKNSWSTYW